MKQKIVNLKDIEKGEILDLISEMLFEIGICVIEFHAEHFFNECTHHKNYRVMYAGDIDIIFDNNDNNDTNEDFPIRISCITTCDRELQTLDLITEDLYETLKVKEQ